MSHVAVAGLPLSVIVALVALLLPLMFCFLVAGCCWFLVWFVGYRWLMVAYCLPFVVVFVSVGVVVLVVVNDVVAIVVIIVVAAVTDAALVVAAVVIVVVVVVIVLL